MLKKTPPYQRIATGTSTHAENIGGIDAPKALCFLQME